MDGQDAAGAVVMRRYGEPDVLRWEEVALAPLGGDEVRLRTIASAVNRADVEIRSGTWPVQRNDPFPYVPGLETVGTVVGTGDTVTALEPGQRAITMMQRLGGIHGERPGGYAAYVTVPAASCAQLPDDVDALDVAALGLAAVTALEGLRRLQLRPCQRVAVHGAGGGVGSAAVSLAGRAGAEAIAVVSRAEQNAYARSLGAAGDALREDIAEIVTALRSGELDPPEYRTLPLSQAADAHRLLEAGGVRGRILLVPGEDQSPQS